MINGSRAHFLTGPTGVTPLLFGEGLPVPEQTVRAAVAAAVDTIPAGPGGSTVGSPACHAPTGTHLAADRARRHGQEPRPLDRDAERGRLAAVFAVVTGKTSMEDIGYQRRAPARPHP
ncbi:hypothetical protein [Streptomyces erythrochromogenes]|uniref:hypothetical protein n=1 Tax=Streptomyces erythrochromogenes TaxID=285574 RepID=UPI0038636C29|nr:hypothetical protein OG364_39760 [Streptomyces erythrochromogenes]